MHVHTWGPEGGPTVLLLHGQLAHGRTWAPLARRLARTAFVLAPDLPGNGRTPLTGRWTARGVQAAIEEQVRDMGFNEMCVVGHSIGCYHALALALGDVIGVHKMVLLGPIAGCDPEVSAMFLTLAERVRSGTIDAVSAMVELALPAEWRAAHPAEVEILCASLNGASLDTFAEELEGIASMEDLRPRLRDVRSEVLVRVGNSDKNTPPAWAEAIATAVPGALLERVPGCGHLPLVQDFGPTSDRVEAFLLR